jgi:hypothetical protein
MKSALFVMKSALFVQANVAVNKVFYNTMDWWGICPTGHWVPCPPPQDSMWSPKVWAEYHKHKLVRESGSMPPSPQEIWKIWVSI